MSRNRAAAVFCSSAAFSPRYQASGTGGPVWDSRGTSLQRFEQSPRSSAVSASFAASGGQHVVGGVARPECRLSCWLWSATKSSMLFLLVVDSSSGARPRRPPRSSAASGVSCRFGVVEDSEQRVVVLGGDGIELMVVAWAQATVRPRKPRVVASTRSSCISGLRA